jgi:hypothetical protein
LSSLGESAQLTATARDADGNAISGKTFEWRSSDSGVASVGSTGLVTAVQNGAATITAVAGGLQGNADVSVEQQLASIAVTPAVDTLTSLGEAVQLSVSAFDANDSVISAQPPATWMALDSAVAIVDTTGMVTSLSNGVAGVAAIHDATGDTAWITVRQMAARVAVVPTSAALSGIGTTADFSATAYDANDSLIANPTVTWSSLNADVVTVAAHGRATSRRDGQGTVAATVDSVSGYALLTIAVPGTGPARTWERGWFQPHNIRGIWGSGQSDVWTAGISSVEGRMRSVA